MPKTTNKKQKTSSYAQDVHSQIEIATQTLERNIAFISNCDNKTSIVLASIGVLLTIILTNDGLKKIYSIIKTCIEQNTYCCILYLLFLAFSIGLMTYGICCLVSVLIAKTSESANGCTQSASHIFFSGIKQYGSPQAFHDEFTALSEYDFLRELTAQIYINSDIASRKYCKYNKGLMHSVIGFSLFVVVLLVGIYLY